MAFRGELGELRLFDVLQMIATTAKSGRLVLKRRAARGLVVFRDGRIVYAASDSLRETLGSLLVSLEMLEEGRLREALELQRSRQPPVRLGVILVEAGWLSEEALEQAVTQQVERVIAELASWSDGFFEFTQMEVPKRGEVEIDTRDLLLDQGLAADHVLLSIAVQIDEAGRDGEVSTEKTDPEGLFDLAAIAGSPSDDTGEATTPTRIAAIKEVLAQVRSPRLTGEVLELLLTNATQVVRRAALFAVHSQVFRGLAQRGVDEPAGTSIGELKIPTAESGLLRQAAVSREIVRAAPEKSLADQLLLVGLGGAAPVEALAAPLTVGEKTQLVLYGDNLPASEPIGPTEELELLLLQTGLAMERAALAERVSQLEFDSVLKSRG